MSNESGTAGGHRREHLHPVTRGVLVAWALGIAQFAYFGLLLGLRLSGTD